MEAGLAGAGTGKSAKRACGRLEAVFGGEMATAKIQTVKGLMLIVFRYRIWYNSFGTDRQIGIGSKL